MKFTEQQTIIFISEYVKYECLYNTYCPEYRSKRIRDAALLEISKTLDIADFGPKEVYQKIRSLKSTYSQELKKIKSSERSGAGTRYIYSPQVKWFKILHDALTAVNKIEKRSDSNVEILPLPEVLLIENNNEEVSANNGMKTNYVNSASYSQTNNNKSPLLHNATDLKRKPKKRIFKDYDNLLTKVQNVDVEHNDNKPAKQSENEFDIFGKSIAAQLNNMPLDLAIEAQMTIQNYLSEMRLKTIQHTVYNSQRSSSSHSNYNIVSLSP